MIDPIVNIVREAGEIMLKAQYIQDYVDSKQGRANYVTKYDIEVQQYLYQELAKHFPSAVFVGEEDDKPHHITNELCFIIDPIDGTTNFIFDYKHSAISVGLIDQGEIIAGVVYHPYLNEMFTAQKGKGAFLNEIPLSLKDLSLSEGIVSMGTCPYYREKADETFLLARKLYDKALDLRRSGSAALDICYVAAGRTVLYYEMLLQPWDFAAASLILREAGGKISRMEQGELNYSEPCSTIAATPTAFEEFFNL